MPNTTSIHSSYIDRIEMHERKTIGNLVMHLEMHLDGFIWELVDVISLPVPLHSSGKEGIEQRLNSSEWHRTRELEDRSGQIISDGLDMLLSLLSRSIVARNKGADFPSPDVLRERRGRRDILETKEGRHLAVLEVLGVIAIPLHDGGSIFLSEEDGSTKYHVDRLGLEEKTCHNAKVPSSTSNRPKEIRMLALTRSHQGPIGQNHVDFE